MLASLLLWLNGLFVARGLVPRWAAQQPQTQTQTQTQTHRGSSGKPSWLVLGLLRSPARGKPARHDKPARHGPLDTGRVLGLTTSLLEAAHE